MSLFILFVIQFFDIIFEDMLFVRIGINWLISYIYIYGMKIILGVLNIIFFKD